MELNVEIPISIFTILNFFILYFVLRRFLFKPLNETLSARRSEIESKLKDAENNKVLAERYKVESEASLKDSKNKGKVLVAEYKSKAEGLHSDIVKGAHTEAKQIIERAVRETEREREKAQAEIKEQVIELALMLSEKALEESINEETHRRLINDFISKVGN
jgi:F-type H+-transporting ATPase subunit b